MKVRIIKDRFGGMGWRAEPGVLHLGGVGTAGVESLSFALPEEWSGMAVTLHIEQEGGTLPQPVLLDESRTVTVDHRFTTARQGLWMLLAQSADGYTAMSCPAKYDCYDTIGLSGTVEDVDPSVYAQFVALVQQAVNTAMNEGAAAKDAAKTAQAAMDAAQKGAAATQKERMSAEDAESAAALAAARTQADITAAAASAASALGAAAETLDACTAATQAANRAANLAPKKEERRLLMRLLREAAYQTRTADTLLDQLSGVWAEVPVEAVRLTRDNLTLYAGERTALGVRISPENATEQTVLWESSDEAVATVEDGVITAKTPGGARITARADGCSAECAVLVKPTVERVSLSTDALALTAGETAVLDAAADPEGDVAWMSSDETVAEVSDGTVTAKKPGAAAILAASGGKYACCAVRVREAEVPVETVALSQTALTLKPGETAALTATVSPEAADQAVVWYSADPETASVTGGEVVAICAGTTEIAAIAGGVKAACSVTVAEDGLRAASLMLSAGTLELTEGRTATLTATVLPTSIPQSSIVWTSSNEEAAVVDGGMVTARAAGAAIIRASVGGKTASCTVTVKAARVPVSSVTLDRSTLELSVDGTARLTATVRPENADDRTVVWQSSREDVATVSGGIVRGVAEGSTVISATAGGVKAECSVTVSQALVWCSVVNRLSHVTTDQTAVVVAKGRAYKAALVHPDRGEREDGQRGRDRKCVERRRGLREHRGRDRKHRHHGKSGGKRMSEPIYNSAGEVLYPGLAGDGAGYRGSRLVTLTPESWEKAEGAWPLMQDAPVPEAKTGYAALGSYPDNYGAAAQEAGCPAYCEARDGFVRFYARAKPSGDIRVQVTLLGNAGGTVVTGLVAGSGVRVNPTLTISGAAADAAATGVRIKLLEMVHGTDVSGISFVSAFDTLDGVELTGVWNKAASRVEF